jgi:cytochrome c oxidase cbb3-type subunit 3
VRRIEAPAMKTRIIALAIMAASLAAAGCRPATGESTTLHPPVALPSDPTMSRIPLGAPPGTLLTLATNIPNPYEGDAVAVSEGQSLFSAMNCVYCHGGGGSGLIGPPLDSHGWRYGGAPAQIYNSIHDGRPQGMPAWGKSLPPDQIWKLVAYIESLGGALPPATAKMGQIVGQQPSATGPQAADQDKTDTAHHALVEGNKSNGG